MSRTGFCLSLAHNPYFFALKGAFGADNLDGVSLLLPF
jgi:hypothetical protein